jgi:hypothetical protein
MDDPVTAVWICEIELNPFCSGLQVADLTTSNSIASVQRLLKRSAPKLDGFRTNGRVGDEAHIAKCDEVICARQRLHRAPRKAARIGSRKQFLKLDWNIISRVRSPS